MPENETAVAAKVRTALEGLPERLRAEIARWSDGDEPNVSAFSRALTGVPGSSRPMVGRYLSGEQVPSLAFTHAAAEVLGVRLEWLMTGEGSRTWWEAGDDAFLADPLMVAIEGFREVIAERLHFRMDTISAQAITLPVALIESVAEARPADLYGGRYAAAESRALRIALDMADAYTAPLELLGIDAERLTSQQRVIYTAAMAQAIASIIPFPIPTYRDVPPEELPQLTPYRKLLDVVRRESADGA